MSINTTSTNSSPVSTGSSIKYNMRSHAEKKKILKEIADFDAEHGRGGARAICRKYGVGLASIYGWRKKYKVCSFSGSKVDEHLKRLTDIRKEIAALQSEYDDLKSKI